MNTTITQSNTRTVAPVLDRSPKGATLASETPLQNGPAAAAILAAGLGAAFMGIIVICESAIHPLSKALIFAKAVGPLSGKTTVAMVAWLGVWAVLHWLWRERNIRFHPVAVATVVLVIVGLLGTFPPVFDLIDGLVN